MNDTIENIKQAILKSLNDAQREAVSAPMENQLLLAGAGSGKTLALVRRIAWLIEIEQMAPHNILAVTFTNKAANEMRARIESVLGANTNSMWVGTFHGIAHKLLRIHFEAAGLPRDFQIIDSDDQLRLVKSIIKAFDDIDEEQCPPKTATWFINNKKDEGLRARHIKEQHDVQLENMLRVYREYEERCDKLGLVDFAELLLRSHELLRDNEMICKQYQSRFQTILVDEFQDTNTLQYSWLRQLYGDQGNIIVVGDDDQSIYGWRGAKIENIRRFQKNFPDVHLIRLEQNYRSTGNIINAANQLIERNNSRLGKKLWTDISAGEKISTYAAFNEHDEARFIVSQIRAWLDDGGAKSECAILYRSNAQSRVIEEALLRADIAYRIYGGLRFFERAEIKDALAYLRLIANRNDDTAFERVINKPTRGIGDRSVQKIRDIARANGISLWQAAEALVKTEELSTRANNAIVAFLVLVDELQQDSKEMSLDEQTKFMLEHTNLLSFIGSERSEKAITRVENLEELVTATKQFRRSDETMSPLSEFLAYAVLEAGEGQSEDTTECVQLMTLHSAKGLEFPLAFIAGMEEGLFPSQRSISDVSRLEEERRLCYVGITRAMKKLYLTYAETRRVYGSEAYHLPSRFIKELPKEALDEIRLRSQVRPTSQTTFSRSSNTGSARPSRTNYSAPPPRKTISKDSTIPGTNLKLGQTVMHRKFGSGVILNSEGQEKQLRIQVRFERAGVKWLVAQYANLEAI